MKIFLVGGYVRDLLLGRKPSDRDWLVVGATEEEFLARFPGAQKVGGHFPVFLVNGEEYAFARMERKVALGHRGFEFEFGPHVTLEDDLLRRDLTINAVAMDLETGVIFMAPGAYEDFRLKRLRHVSEHFAEDPLRVYRVARFAAQLPDFSIASETIALMRKLKRELHTLSAERVFMELKKALAAPAPRRFFEVLLEADVLDVHFPEVQALVGVPAGKNKHKDEKDAFEHTMNVLSYLKEPLLRFAALCHDLGKALTDPDLWPSHHGHDKLGEGPARTLCDRLRTPARWKKTALMATTLHMKAHRLPEMRAGKAVKLIEVLARFPGGGVRGFLDLCVADGMDADVAENLVQRSQKVLAIRLPERYHGLGPKCGEILLNLRAQAWKRFDLKGTLVTTWRVSFTF
ncbi:HD domain-containing protein [Thermosulfurimonas sp. F29]|uniref:HD domain-containing protein n=1 Tax=Thermosulfurimonas sp. F29 TaxID=2867247 RepID=UPI001C82BE24|nr:HD domain-containing protein [Thermosulfurimonas sp. F29]MBX6424170.1 HD domain-containing protein [Thermosulfurimonas sp. F29]